MTKKLYTGKNKRELYRISYPVNDRPTLKFQGNAFEVTNLSEKGIRFICKQCSEFKIDEEVKCMITFHDNESYALDGKILHIYKSTVVINFTRDIPFERIIKEQRYILTSYPNKLS